MAMTLGARGLPLTGPATETEAQRSARLVSDQILDIENLSTKNEDRGEEQPKGTVKTLARKFCTPADVSMTEMV